MGKQIIMGLIGKAECSGNARKHRRWKVWLSLGDLEAPQRIVPLTWIAKSVAHWKAVVSREQDSLEYLENLYEATKYSYPPF